MLNKNTKLNLCFSIQEKDELKRLLDDANRKLNEQEMVRIF